MKYWRSQVRVIIWLKQCLARDTTKQTEIFTPVNYENLETKGCIFLNFVKKSLKYSVDRGNQGVFIQSQHRLQFFLCFIQSQISLQCWWHGGTLTDALGQCVCRDWLWQCRCSSLVSVLFYTHINRHNNIISSFCSRQIWVLICNLGQTVVILRLWGSSYNGGEKLALSNTVFTWINVRG